MDPSMGGPPQGIRNSVGEMERLGIRNEVVSCDAPGAAWLGRDDFPIHALGPGKYGFAYTPKLGAWLEENLGRFNAVIVHGLWLWPSVCATRAVARERKRREAENCMGHGLGKINADGSERLAADRTGGNAASPVTRAGGELSEETTDGEDAAATYPLSPTNQLRCFVMPHGMLDPWFQRDKSRRVKAVRNWFYWWLLERGVVNSADALLFTCQQELELARTTFGGYRPKREINVGYGIAEPPAFEPKMQEAFAERCPGLNARPYLLFMSRVHPKKGVDLLVRAYARIAREHGAWSMEHGATERAEPERSADGRRQTGGLRPEDGAELQVSGFIPQVSHLPDLVIAGPGWDSDYGREVRGLIDEANKALRAETGGLRAEVGSASAQSDYGVTRDRTADGVDAAATKSEHRTLNTEHSAPIHAVDMLSGAEKWGALYGCEAFVLPSHQENFGIAVVEALACGKPVLISDQVNIWREIVEDGAGLVEADTEEGVEKLLRSFLERWRGGPDGVVSPPQAERAEGGGLRPEVGDQNSEFGHSGAELSHSRVCETAEGKLTRIDTDESERLAADRTKGECLVPGIAYGPSTASRPPVPALGALSAESLNVQRSTLNSTMGHRARECYLKRFAIGPAAAKLAEALRTES
jgi:glycosyltransferase involved in cell wall biosynthesis